MSDSLPQIRIKDAWLVRENISVPLNELWGDGSPLFSDDHYADIVKQYQKAWQPYETKILTAMCEITGLQFRQDIIDVYIAPWFAAFSDPMIIGVSQKPDVFVDVLTHEIIHRLLTDNTSLPNDEILGKVWAELFGKHTLNTLIHIPVHAIHKAIYCDVLKQPDHMAGDIASSKESNDIDYIKAWEYVEKHDYQKIIAKLKQSYQDIAAKR